LPVPGTESAPWYTSVSVPDRGPAASLFERSPTIFDDLDARIEAFVSALASVDDPLQREVAEALRSIAGKIVVGRQVDEITEHRRAQAVMDAFDRYVDSHFERVGDRFRVRGAPEGGASSDGADSFERLAQGQARQYEEDMEAVLPYLKGLTEHLKDEPAVGRRLREFLQLDVGPHIAYTTVIRPRLRPDPIEKTLGMLFVTDARGRVRIPAGNEGIARQSLDRAMAQLTALDRVVQEARELARKVVETDDLHRRCKRAMADEVFIALSVMEQRQKNRSLPADQAAEQGWDELQGVFRSTAGGRRLKEGAAPRMEHALRDYEDARASLPALRETAERFVSRMAPMDGLHQAWGEFLGRDVALVGLARANREGPNEPLDVVKSSTFLGVGIVGNAGGGFEVIGHAQLAVSEGLRAMIEARGELEALYARVDAFAEALSDPPMRKLYGSLAGKFIVSEAVRGDLEGRSIDGFAVWTGRHFEQTESGYRVREASRSLLAALLTEVREIERATAGGEPLIVDLSRLAFSTTGVNLFRSSSFFNPRTPGGEAIYRNEFEDHFAARLFHVFEWDVQQSKDLASFREHLWARRDRLADLARSHERFVVALAMMPEWLSVSTDHTLFEGVWKNLHAHSPRRYETWNDLVRETVTFFKQFAGVRMYYEVWNEPDGAYWQEGLAAYLKLYEETARTIKAADPSAQVGGAAVNYWSGKLRTGGGRDPLNIALIRHATERRLPLDFISWHAFDGNPATLAEAKAAYEAVIREVGAPLPLEFHVTEWNNASNIRDTPYSAAGLAEHLVAMHKAGIDMQTMAAWEDFHLRPDPKDFAPYGLITQAGRKKPEYFAHRFFDRISRDTTGVVVVKLDEGPTKAVISNKGGGRYDILVWRFGLDPPMAAAVAHLKEQGLTKADAERIGNLEDLEEAVRSGRAPESRWQAAFVGARQVYVDHAAPADSLTLEFAGKTRVSCWSAASVRSRYEPKRVFTAGNRLSCSLRAFELLWLELSTE